MKTLIEKFINISSIHHLLGDEPAVTAIVDSHSLHIPAVAGSVEVGVEFEAAACARRMRWPRLLLSSIYDSTRGGGGLLRQTTKHNLLSC